MLNIPTIYSPRRHDRKILDVETEETVSLSIQIVYDFAGCNHCSLRAAVEC